MYRFVDRDIFMQFCGGGIGHKATCNWNKFLQHEGHGYDKAGSNESDWEEDVEGKDLKSEDNYIRLEVDKKQDGKGDEEDEEDRVITEDRMISIKQ